MDILHAHLPTPFKPILHHGLRSLRYDVEEANKEKRTRPKRQPTGHSSRVHSSHGHLKNIYVKGKLSFKFFFDFNDQVIASALPE